MIHIIFHDKTGVTPYNPGQTGGFENAAGSGEIHYYRLFDGVGIMLLRLEMETYTEIRTQIGMIEINFCINGRFETSFSMRDSVLLKPGIWPSAATTDGMERVQSHGSRWAVTKGCVWKLIQQPLRTGLRRTHRAFRWILRY